LFTSNTTRCCNKELTNCTLTGTIGLREKVIPLTILPLWPQKEKESSKYEIKRGCYSIRVLQLEHPQWDSKAGLSSCLMRLKGMAPVSVGRLFVVQASCAHRPPINLTQPFALRSWKERTAHIRAGAVDEQRRPDDNHRCWPFCLAFLPWWKLLWWLLLGAGSSIMCYARRAPEASDYAKVPVPCVWWVGNSGDR